MPAHRDGQSPDSPVPGFFAVRLTRGGVECAAQIIMDDEGNLSGLINGEIVRDGEVDANLTFPDKLQNIWLWGRKIDKGEYDYLLARYHHYRINDPADPRARPKEKVNRRLMKPIGG
jgi:hypothetical protein